MEKEFLLGVGITNATQNKILEYIVHSAEKKQESSYIVTPNPEMLVLASKNIGFKQILNNAKIALCDGVGLVLAARLLGKQLKSRVTGVDLMEALCREVAASNAADAEKPITVGFLGGGAKVAEGVAECLLSKYPGLKVVFVAPEWGEEGFARAGKYYVSSSKYYGKESIKNSLNTKYTHSASSGHNTRIDILFVAFGFPKQEEWMAANAHVDKSIFHVAIGVGGAFDYISGNVWRAPLIIRSIGFEWLFRLVMQPWRIKRQLALLSFAFLVLKEKFISHNS